jgi:response regulator RpfG family c-di-GMP phosphodiesterase
VADVIDAMTSHRPYRQALAIEIAMDEISRNKNVLYDPYVVDKCIFLIQNRRLIANNSSSIQWSGEKFDKWVVNENKM